MIVTTSATSINSGSPGSLLVSVQFKYDRVDDIKDIIRSPDIFADILFSDGLHEVQSMKDWYGIWDANRDNPRYFGIIDWLIENLELDLNGYLKGGKWKDVVRQALDTWVIGENELKWILFYSGASSSMGERFHVFINGDSQKGKSYIEGKVSELFPTDRVITIQSMSGKAAYYHGGEKGADYYANKILVLDEFADLSDDTRVTLKALMSLGDRPLVNDTVSDQKKAVRQVIEGRPVIWANSAELFDDALAQLKNRFFTASIDESEDLDRKVNDRQRAVAKYGRTPEDLETVELAKKLISVIMAERGFIILMPLIDQIKQRDMGNRGEFERFCVLVSSIAYVNRFQRLIFEEGGNKYILASMADLTEAMNLWNHFNKSQSTGIGPRHQRVLEVMNTYPMSLEEITAAVSVGMKKGRSTKTIYNYLGELADRDLVSSVREQLDDGKPITKYALVNSNLSRLAQFFPSENWGEMTKLRSILAKEIDELQARFPNFPTNHDIIMGALLDVEEMPVQHDETPSMMSEEVMKDLFNELRCNTPGAFHTMDSLVEAGFNCDLLNRLKRDGIITIEPSGRWILARG